MKIETVTYQILSMTPLEERLLYQAFQSNSNTALCCGKQILRWNLMGGKSKILLEGEAFEMAVALVAEPEPNPLLQNDRPTAIITGTLIQALNPTTSRHESKP